MKRLTALACTVICTIICTATLGGCAAGTYDDPIATDGTTYDSDGISAEERVFKTKDGRRVNCITYRKGLSCDWNHADGADRQ